MKTLWITKKENIFFLQHSLVEQTPCPLWGSNNWCVDGTTAERVFQVNTLLIPLTQGILQVCKLASLLGKWEQSVAWQNNCIHVLAGLETHIQRVWNILWWIYTAHTNVIYWAIVESVKSAYSCELECLTCKVVPQIFTQEHFMWCGTIWATSH